jgi:hypothetical protein
LSSSDLFGVFGREVFKLVTDRVADMTMDEDDDEIMDIAGRHGLAKQVPYDPELHGDVPEAEPGQTIWWWGDTPNSMFGPKSPAERAASRDSMISWSNYEIVGGDCQYVNFGQNAPQTKPLGWGHGWGSSPRRCALERQWVEGANASS